MRSKFLCFVTTCCLAISVLFSTVTLGALEAYAIEPAAYEGAMLVAAQSSTATKTPRKAATKTEARKKKKGKKRKNSVVLPRFGYKSAVLFNDSTKKIVFSKNGNTPIPPASLTKIISMFVALDAMKAKKIAPSTMVTVSAKAAAAKGSRLGLRKGDKVSLDHLLRGMAISSGNDASIAVAEFIGGNEKNFVLAMNKKARAIGMKKTTFKNANGLPAKGQFTTANDMLALVRSYLAAYPENLRKYHSHKFNTYKGGITTNANPLLGQFAGADGLKTGYVDASGYNLIATAKRGNVRIIGVILGAPTSGARAAESKALMEAGFGKLAVSVQDAEASTPKGAKSTKKAASQAPASSDKGKEQPSTKGASTKKKKAAPAEKTPSAATKKADAPKAKSATRVSKSTGESKKATLQPAKRESKKTTQPRTSSGGTSKAQPAAKPNKKATETSKPKQAAPAPQKSTKPTKRKALPASGKAAALP